MGTALGMAGDAVMAALLPVNLDQVGTARGVAVEPLSWPAVMTAQSLGRKSGQLWMKFSARLRWLGSLAGSATNTGCTPQTKFRGLDGHRVGGQGVDVLGRTAAGDLTGRRAAELVGRRWPGMGLSASRQAGRPEFRMPCWRTVPPAAVIDQQLLGLVGDLAHVLTVSTGKLPMAVSSGEHHAVGAVGAALIASVVSITVIPG